MIINKRSINPACCQGVSSEKRLSKLKFFSGTLSYRVNLTGADMSDAVLVEAY